MPEIVASDTNSVSKVTTNAVRGVAATSEDSRVQQLYNKLSENSNDLGPERVKLVCINFRPINSE